MSTTYISENAKLYGIAHNVAYNGNYDIVWSFDYSLSGASGAEGSFTTFLFAGDTPFLTGGGVGPGGGYADVANYFVGSVATSAYWTEGEGAFEDITEKWDNQDNVSYPEVTK